MKACSSCLHHPKNWPNFLQQEIKFNPLVLNEAKVDMAGDVVEDEVKIVGDTFLSANCVVNLGIRSKTVKSDSIRISLVGIIF